MATDEQDGGSDDRDRERLAEQLKASAQQIWLAGLGAFAKAQEEGSRMFDALVREGSALQRKAAEANAGERFAEATSRMASLASELSAKAGERLEGVVDTQVAKAVERLGVPSAAEFEALAARVDELERKLARATANRRRPARSETKPAAPRARPRDGS